MTTSWLNVRATAPAVAGLNLHESLTAVTQPFDRSITESQHLPQEHLLPVMFKVDQMLRLQQLLVDPHLRAQVELVGRATGDGLRKDDLALGVEGHVASIECGVPRDRIRPAKLPLGRQGQLQAESDR